MTPEETKRLDEIRENWETAESVLGSSPCELSYVGVVSLAAGNIKELLSTIEALQKRVEKSEWLNGQYAGIVKMIDDNYVSLEDENTKLYMTQGLAVMSKLPDHPKAKGE